jgi:predicted secreted protein
LEVRKKEYDLAVAQLERARGRSRLERPLRVDVVRAESGWRDRIEAIINAETAIRNTQRDL